MKVVFFEIQKKEEDVLRNLMPGLDVEFHPAKLSLENIAEARSADVISVFINSQIMAQTIDALPQLKHIATRSTGFDHIEIGYAKSKGVSVSNVPSYGSRTVAEFTFGLILNLSRKIFKARKYIMESDDFNFSEQFEGFDLFGKTLGVVGTGKIGRNVIKIAKSFGLNVVACDMKPAADFAEEQGFKYMELKEVLAASDIVTLHTPYFKENHHLINSENINRMKPGAYLINTARGELVETEALLKALEMGRLAGAGLDVLESELDLKEEAELLIHDTGKMKDMKIALQNHKLMNMPQVVITPHIAFFSREAREEILKTTAENIKSFINGSAQHLIQ